MKVAPWLVALSFAAGCTVQQASPTGAGGGATASAPPGTTCLQILQCAADCAENDTACENACLDSGTEEGKSTVTTLATCVDSEQCTDAACIKDKCADSLNACVTSSAPKNGGSPLTGSAPPGSVPADLAGTWAGARNGITERLVFNADGTGSWTSSVVSQQSACFSFTRTIREGTVVIEEKTITVYAPSVKEQVQECAPPAAETIQPAVTETLKWSRVDGDPNTIRIVDNACAAKYPGTEDCNLAGCPIGLYCTSRLERE
jgi:hypothetical protein